MNNFSTRGYRNSYGRRSNLGFGFGWGLALLAVVVVAFLVFVGAKSYYSDDFHSACQVVDKDRTSGDNASMRIYTENCGTFIVKDSFIKTDYRSADRYAKIKVGKTYDIKSYGWRIGVFSAFPKIVTATEVR